MLNALGKFITRNRWWVIGTWFAAAVVITLAAPKLSSVVSSNQTSFLPSKYESVQAEKIADKAFPQAKNDAELLLVERKDGGRLTPTDLQNIQILAASIQAAKLPHVQAAVAPLGSLSQDGTAQLVSIVTDIQSGGSESDAKLVNQFRDTIKKYLAGSDLKAGLTGNLAMNADSTDSFNNAEKVITFATFLLVILLPGIIFRSPVAAFAPVLAVSLVYMLAQSIIALSAHIFDFKISNQLSILFTVVLFGIGTDYILFLLFRYRERLRTGDVTRGAVAFALSRAGEAILSAALVVAAAFAALGISDFGIFKNLAPGLVICVLTMLLASLTLIPAVIAVIGPKIFWPSKAWQHPAKHGAAARVGRTIAKRPALVAAGAFIVLALLASGYFHLHTDYNTLNQLPQNTESTKAYNELSKKFSASAIAPTPVYFVSAQSLETGALRDIQQATNGKIDALPAGPATLSADKKIIRVSFYLKGNPYENSTLDYIDNVVRPTMHAIGGARGYTTYVAGESAAFADVRSAVNRDLAVILPTAAVVIFLILLILLRSILAPLYLLVTAALGFTATLGGTVYLFQNVAGNAGLIFFIPIMVYIFVVAIGTDYNILIMTRLREEVREGHEPRKASDLTIEHSGATVASAGLILAGTFGSLALAGLSLLAQLGFAVAFGIVLSAFCISTLLVPSVAALLGRNVWWPGHRPATDKNHR